jgi:putative radical SAM enzyme (TIGR03279 family)
MESKRELRHIIKSVLPGSIASEMELEAGDEVLRISGKKMKDVIDYHYLIHDEYLTLIVVKKDGEEWELEIEKEYDDDLGIEFEDGLMDKYLTCHNKCVFCFIDQNPNGMRDTIYFKDDDARLSFLQGNYITLTNMTEEEVERICFYKLSPINISVHTTNKELRQKMLNNRFAGEKLAYLDRFYEAGIEMNGQVVLCPEYNDGAELDKTIEDLSKYLPFMKSMSIVPVGLSKHRKNLTELRKFTKEEAQVVIQQVEKWQKKIKKERGTRFVYLSDEWYLNAGLPMPGESEYEQYPQIENGVGMIRSLTDEVEDYLATLASDNRVLHYSLITGTLAADTMKELVEKVKQKYPNLQLTVYPIVNDYYGHDITVAGLLTGQDIIGQLTGKDLGDALLMPNVMLRSQEEVLLDNVTVKDIENALQTTVRIVKSDGMSLVNAMIE